MDGLYDGEFAGFKIASSEQLETALREAVVAVDANVLLDLYRFRRRTSQDLIDTLKTLGDRLVVPHQALREFWRRRRRSLDSPRGATKTATDALAKADRSIRDALSAWGRAVGVDADELASIIGRVDNFIGELQGELQGALQEAVTEQDRDPILEQLENLLAGRVTPSLDQEIWDECIAEANRRIEAGEPPGYLDADKQEGEFPEGGAGDYLVWYQATRFAKERERDLLIITRDQKEDWWWRQQSDLVGPRPELALEYHRLTGNRLFLMLPADLLKRAPALGVEVDQESPSDAKQIADTDQYRLLEEGTGRRYRRVDITATGTRPRFAYEWHGTRPPEGRHWRYSQDRMDQMYADGRIEFNRSGTPLGKQYLDEHPSATS